jgi:hypothetical protein
MLLTEPDSVKIFIMFLLLQSLVCDLGRSLQARRWVRNVNVVIASKRRLRHIGVAIKTKDRFPP